MLFTVLTGKPLDPAMPIINAVSNVICSLILGHRFSLEDENFRRLIETIDDVSAFMNSSWFYVRIFFFFGYFIQLDNERQLAGYFYNKNEY